MEEKWSVFLEVATTANCIADTVPVVLYLLSPVPFKLNIKRHKHIDLILWIELNWALSQTSVYYLR